MRRSFVLATFVLALAACGGSTKPKGNGGTTSGTGASSSGSTSATSSSSSSTTSAATSGSTGATSNGSTTSSTGNTTSSGSSSSSSSSTTSGASGSTGTSSTGSSSTSSTSTSGTTGTSGGCGGCTTPPASTCDDGSHLRVYDNPGTCSGSACSYLSHLETCTYGCGSGACQADPCANLTCNASAPSCLDANTLRIPSSSCVAGSCQQSYTDQTCANGCSNGACNAPSCSGSTCNSPPAASCLDPKVQKAYASAGSCSGSCSYQELDTWCSQGCLSGTCDLTSWKALFMPLPPGSQQAWDSIAFAVDSAGNPHLVGADSSGNVTWRHLDASGWHDVAVDSNLGYGVQVALALANGQPVVAYYEPTNQRLRYAELQNGAFHVEQVTTTNGTGTHPAITVDASGTRWIAYDGTAGTIVAHGHAGAWTNESVLSANGYHQIAIDPSGVVQLVIGADTSSATPQGSWQSPAYRAWRSGGTWSTEQFTNHGVLFHKAMRFASNGDLLLPYGYVSDVGQSDELRFLRRGSTSSDALGYAIGNWQYNYAVGAWGDASDVHLVFPDATEMLRGEDDFWTSLTMDLPQYTRILDLADGPDGRPRYLVSMSSSSPANLSGMAVVTPTACVPSCASGSCGSDGCGGTCGSCGAGLSCSAGQCSSWSEETLDLPPATISQYSYQGAYATSPDGTHQVLVRHEFPENYYTSGSVQDELWYTSDAPPPFAVQTVVGVPRGAYANEWLFNTSLVLDGSGTPTAIFNYELMGAGTTVNAATWPAQDGGWTPAWSQSNGQGSQPSALSASENAQGVIYAAYTCGYYADVTCVNRVAAGTVVQSNLAGQGSSATSIAVDPGGFGHVLYATEQYDNSGNLSTNLFYATDASGSWVSTAIPGEAATTSQTYAPRVAVAPDGTVHLLWHSAASGQMTHAVVNGTSFTTDVVSGASPGADLEIDPSGRPAILTVASSGVALLRSSSSGWTTDAIPVHGNYFSSDLRLTFDAAGHAHAYFVDSPQLRVARK